MADRDSGARRSPPEGENPHTGEHLSPKRADEQKYPPEERPTTPIEEAGERKGDESGDGGTARRGP